MKTQVTIMILMIIQYTRKFNNKIREIKREKEDFLKDKIERKGEIYQ